MVLAFAYILITVIVVLEVPLAFNLQRRAEAEVRTNALLNAQIIAADVGAERVAAASGKGVNLAQTPLQRWAYRNFPHSEDGRVIIVNPEGILIADSMGAQNLGRQYATAKRPELVSVLHDQKPTSAIRPSETLGYKILVAAVPILDEGKFYGAVRLSTGMAQVQDRVRGTILGLMAIGGAGLLAGLIIAFALAGSFSRPLSRLAAAAKRLGEGDLSARADTSEGATEIVQLGRSFDDMADRMESTVKAQREFVANASHQLRTPLTGMRLRLESALAEVPGDEIRRHLDAADKEVDRLSEIVDRLLVMARRIEEGGPSEIDLDEAVARAVDRWEERASREGATLTAKGQGGRALGEPADVDQILDNLIDNAISYAAGPIVIETGRADGRVFVAVEDHGPGIAPDERHRVMDRFFRGRGAPPGGSGLGLAIVRDLAEKSGGRVAVDAAEGGGTRIEVRLNPAPLTFP